MPYEYNTHVAVIMNSGYDFIPAELLDEQIVDRMSVVGVVEVQVSWQAGFRGLSRYDQDRISDALFREAGLVDVDRACVCYEVEIVLL